MYAKLPEKSAVKIHPSTEMSTKHLRITEARQKQSRRSNKLGKITLFAANLFSLQKEAKVPEIPPANFPAETVSNGRQISLRKDAKLFEIPREFPTDKVSKGRQISLQKEAKVPEIPRRISIAETLSNGRQISLRKDAKLFEIPREFPTDKVSKGHQTSRISSRKA